MGRVDLVLKPNVHRDKPGGATKLGTVEVTNAKGMPTHFDLQHS